MSESGQTSSLKSDIRAEGISSRNNLSEGTLKVDLFVVILVSTGKLFKQTTEQQIISLKISVRNSASNCRRQE
jgi:hypothetical protein